MTVTAGHIEAHRVSRIGWLRAAVLGPNDGIVSTASLILGVAAASAGRGEILVAGAMSMAAGEYVSVSSQSDTERGELARERFELDSDPTSEHAELVRIYVARGVDAVTADAVAVQMMAHDAVGAHARDELGISDLTAARPLQAALTSAATFTAGAALPLATALLVPSALTIPLVAAGSLLFLALLGALGAIAGGANIARATLRVAFWGALAMGLTAGIGRIVGTAV
jgi:vacuolar iron transporter family protein